MPGPVAHLARHQPPPLNRERERRRHTSHPRHALRQRETRHGAIAIRPARRREKVQLGRRRLSGQFEHFCDATPKKTVSECHTVSDAGRPGRTGSRVAGRVGLHDRFNQRAHVLVPPGLAARSRSRSRPNKLINPRRRARHDRDPPRRVLRRPNLVPEPVDRLSFGEGEQLFDVALWGARGGCARYVDGEGEVVR